MGAVDPIAFDKMIEAAANAPRRFGLAPKTSDLFPTPMVPKLPSLLLSHSLALSLSLSLSHALDRALSLSLMLLLVLSFSLSPSLLPSLPLFLSASLASESVFGALSGVVSKLVTPKKTFIRRCFYVQVYNVRIVTMVSAN